MEHGDNPAIHHSISGYILPETLFHNTEPVTFSKGKGKGKGKAIPLQASLHSVPHTTCN